MRLTFSNHAFERMFARGISTDEIRAVVERGEVGFGFQEEEETMKCVLCKHGDTAPGVTTVTLQRGDVTIIVKGVPAAICDNCGEYYLDEPIASRVYELAEAAVKSGAEVEIRRFAA